MGDNTPKAEPIGLMTSKHGREQVSLARLVDGKAGQERSGAHENGGAVGNLLGTVVFAAGGIWFAQTQVGYSNGLVRTADYRSSVQL